MSIKRGFDFWVGVVLAVIAFLAVGYAIIDPCWRMRIKDIASPISALAVVGAALIAYDGALSKVRFDGLVTDKADDRIRRGTVLRLNLACAELHKLATSMDATLAFANDSGLGLQQVKTDDSLVANLNPFMEQEASDQLFIALIEKCRINEPQDMIEAWRFLDLFSEQVAGHLFNLRFELVNLDGYLNHCATANGLKSRYGIKFRRTVRDAHSKIAENASQIRAHLAKDVKNFTSVTAVKTA